MRNDVPLPQHIERELLAANEERMKRVADLIDRHPEYRQHIAYGILGDAVAYADTFGCDVERFVEELRRRHPRPAILVPHSRRSS